MKRTVPKKALAKRQVVTRQEAAMQQIDMAIEMIGRGEYACAITLSLAAETQMPEPDVPHVMAALKRQLTPAQIDDLNAVRNWLKHSRAPDTATLYKFEATISILRAISKFRGCYGAWSEDMAAFDVWVKETLLEGDEQ